MLSPTHAFSFLLFFQLFNPVPLCSSKTTYTYSFLEGSVLVDGIGSCFWRPNTYLWLAFPAGLLSVLGKALIAEEAAYALSLRCAVYAKTHSASSLLRVPSPCMYLRTSSMMSGHCAFKRSCICAGHGTHLSTLLQNTAIHIKSCTCFTHTPRRAQLIAFLSE